MLLHGGVLTIDLSWSALLPVLAADRTVVAMEAQGHGRTSLGDRELTYAGLAGDVVAVLDDLGHDRAVVVGHSMGGATALQLLVTDPERVAAAVPMSASLGPQGLHPDLLDPSTYETSPIMPTADDFAAMKSAYDRLSPHPERFDELVQRAGAMDADFGWDDETLAPISCPVLLVQGDTDFTTLDHAAEMHRRIPDAQLCVLPGTTHMQVTRRVDVLAPVLARFLADLPA